MRASPPNTEENGDREMVEPNDSMRLDDMNSEEEAGSKVPSRIHSVTSEQSSIDVPGTAAGEGGSLVFRGRAGSNPSPSSLLAQRTVGFDRSRGITNSPRIRRSSLTINMDAAGVGDYDMKKSQSTAALVQEAMEDSYMKRVRARLGTRFEELVEETRGGTPVASSLLGAASAATLEGLDAISDDEFWRCFEKKRIEPWNWNTFLFPMWCFGVLFRYLVLFPIRVAILIVGWCVFTGTLFLVQALLWKGPFRSRLERGMISLMSKCFVLTWFGVIRYHGRIPTSSASLRSTSSSQRLAHLTSSSPGKPKPATNVVFVANHSSLIDVIVLQQVKCFSLLGQKHKGFVRFIQERVLACLQCIWFDRGEMRDRAVVSRKLTEHAKDPIRNPLLIFPEGTCVNNEHVIQFKKGAFELGVPIVPVAIKYTKLFVDPFWSSRDQSFIQHLIELMTSWCMICDVWFMEPTSRRDGESAEGFAKRVRDSIAKQAGLKAVDWDGYLKHFSASKRLVEQRKQVYAAAFGKLLGDLKKEDEEKLRKMIMLSRGGSRSVRGRATRLEDLIEEDPSEENEQEEQEEEEEKANGADEEAGEEEASPEEDEDGRRSFTPEEDYGMGGGNNSNSNAPESSSIKATVIEHKSNDVSSAAASRTRIGSFGRPVGLSRTSGSGKSTGAAGWPTA